MEFDIIVIGSGPGGYVAAIRAAQLGKKVAIVEKAELGGVCLNWGCIPTKALLKSAHVLNDVNNAATYGIEVPNPGVPNLEKIIARSRGVAQTMSKGVSMLISKNNIEVVAGHATLLGGGLVEVCDSDGAKRTIKSDHIILATGARPREFPFIPIDGKSVITSRQALVLDKLPQSMVVAGSGAIGSEFAYLYACLGVKVTIVEYMPNLMPLSDEDVSKYMERSFRKLRVNVITSTAVKSVAVVDGRCRVEIEGKKGVETIETDVVLSALGIKSNIENLGLEALGVVVERDKIVVDGFGATNVKGVYAVGDIVTTQALAHVASAEAVVCVEKICGLNPEPVDYTTIPSCVYTSPEVSAVGMTEKEAIERGHEVKIGKFPLTASGKATSDGDRDGFIKLIFDSSTDKLLGAHFVGLNVTEMISEATLAKTLGATAHQIAKTIHPHPTISESLMEAAEAASGYAIHL